MKVKSFGVIFHIKTTIRNLCACTVLNFISTQSFSLYDHSPRCRFLVRLPSQPTPTDSLFPFSHCNKVEEENQLNIEEKKIH